MTNDFEIIGEFIQYENDKPALNAGLPVLAPMPVVKTTADIERLIALGKPQAVIEQFAELVSLGEQWQFAHEYIEYLAQLAKAEAHNADLPIVGKDENGDDVLAEPMALPVAPEKPSAKSIDEVLAPFKPKLTKMAAFEFKGVQCSICEQDQNGLGAVNDRYKELRERDVEFRPFGFKLENGNVVLIDTEQDWQTFRDEFWGAREAYMMAKMGLSNEA